MMTELTEAVQYSTFDTHDIVVRRLHEDRVAEVAPHVLRLIAHSYSSQFEPHFVPEGTFARTYDYTDEKRVAAQVQRMQTVMSEHDTQYWLAYADNELHPVGLAKVAPQYSSARRMIESTSSLLRIDSLASLARPEVALHDIIVHPQVQKRHIGSFTVHAALSYGGFDPESQVSLDGFVGNPVNAWFRSLGFVSTNKQGTFMADAGHSMPQQRYLTPRGATLSTVVQNIERKNPGMGYRSL